jgi:fructose-1,6-bisphosphatase/inositol monophosphatase family enzyme
MYRLADASRISCPPARGTGCIASTTLALAWVAAGRRAAYVTDGHLLDSVRFAAGIASCRAAGCTVTGIHGQPLHTGAGGLVAAADGQTHAVLVEMTGTRRRRAGKPARTRSRAQRAVLRRA